MSDTNSGPDAPVGDEKSGSDTDTVGTVEKASEAQPEDKSDNSGNDTFPRTYVEDLRKESAGYRDRAKQAEERAEALARRLHAALVRATGNLVDPDALTFDAEHLDNDQKLSAAIEALTEAKPYLKARKVAGDAGQGPRGGSETAPSWADLFKRA